MTVKIFNPNIIEEEDVYLKLNDYNDGRITLCVVTEKGIICKNILSITEDGVHLCSAVSNIGIATECGQVVMI